MINHTITILTLTAGLGGLIALAPAPAEQAAPPPPPPAPAAVAVPAPTDAPPARTTRARAEWSATYDAIRKELKELNAAYQKAESTYEKEAIRARLEKVKRAIAELKAAAEQREAPPAGRGIGAGKAPPADEAAPEPRRRAERTEVQAMLEKAKALEWEGRHEEAAAIRERLRDAKQRAAREAQVANTIRQREEEARARGRASGRAGGVLERRRNAADMKQAVGGLMMKAKELEAQGDLEASEQLRQKANQIMREFELQAAQAEAGILERRPRAAEEPGPERGRAARRAPRAGIGGPPRGTGVPGPRPDAAPAPEAAPLPPGPEAAPMPPQPDRRSRGPAGVARRGRAPQPAPPATGIAVGPPPMAGGEFQQRLEHLLQAAENLDAAGMPDEAARLRERADTMRARARAEMESRARAAMESRQREPGPDVRDLAAQVEQLQHEVQELHAIVHELMDRVNAYHAERQ